MRDLFATSNRSGMIRLTLVWCLFSTVPALVNGAEESAMDFFEKEIRPLLIENCQKCHGATKQFGGLRLDSREAVLKGGESGAAVVGGNLAESLLIQAVRHADGLQMPPDKKLSAPQIEALERWVTMGAPWPASVAQTDDLAEKYRTHWAFQPVSNPPLPSVSEDPWCRTPVDAFILQKLNDVTLTPSRRADRRTLIRRVTYDLTGLPPSPEEVAAFENDESPDSYAKLVERLLDSPQYGEQWARHWLDVARYSDTKGYVYGREERVWVHAPAYRDWVVKAFNRDLPYNEFLLLQIAADQAAPHDPSAAAAMGFLTVGRRFLGVTHDVIDDRIDVVTRGTMGLTVACARCHDHKYDPIPTADYYSLYGVFMNSTERLSAAGEPAVRDEAYAAFETELEKRKQTLRDTMLAKRIEGSDRLRQRFDEYLIAQTELSKYPEEGFDQVLAVTDVLPVAVRRIEGWLAMEDRVIDPVFAPWRAYAKLKAEEFASRGGEVLAELAASGIAVNSRVAQALATAPTSMRDVAERYGKLFKEVNQQWREASEAAKGASLPEPTKLEAPEAEELRQVLYGPGSPCLIPDEPIVSIEYLFDTGTLSELWRLQGEVDRWIIQSPLAPPHALSLVDRASIRPSRIFRRGNPANRGAEVSRHFVSVVAGPTPKPFTQGSGRHELAQAIIDPSNPLTARVWVNRVWQHHFGVGLVRTPSDFGIRAEPPSHPELLDWLATQLITGGWSTKNLHRLILLSNTYQQISAAPADPVEAQRVSLIDPENKLLSRMNVRRMSFEEFRDTLLAASGRLDLQSGGRGSDIFAMNGTQHRRRTLYGLIDRQFLPATLRIFDFANPDLHIPARSETTVPQQALFALNHPFVASQSKSLVSSVREDGATDAQQVTRLFQRVYQREPTAKQLETALAFLQLPAGEDVAPRTESLAWKYGYGELNPATKELMSFTPLPHYTGSAWQGGENWPDAALGWARLTATGGHPGNDLQHCCVRRWVAPRAGTYSVESTVIHSTPAGNGIRCWVFSSRNGAVSSLETHNQTKPMNVTSIELHEGDSLDFVVDLNGDLNNDQFEWSMVVRLQSGDAPDAAPMPRVWDSAQDFTGPMMSQLNRWEQLAQVLLISNELMFVD
ncbi:PSD1 and planctomycete cytochrome C domain-containing protein [Schlesneria sp. T3-172]|uniref:PSD1 and planctomycete cytochrome C domain-containing protein n=1 Tax=Schlesneria sphaerica TaxID=3373610 RepID=UPI0037C69C97